MMRKCKHSLSVMHNFPAFSRQYYRVCVFVVIYLSPDGSMGARPSIDKEMAAHTLLDLSKVSSSEETSTSSKRDGAERPKLRRQRSVPTTDDDDKGGRTSRPYSINLWFFASCSTLIIKKKYWKIENIFL